MCESRSCHEAAEAATRVAATRTLPRLSVSTIRALMRAGVSTTRTPPRGGASTSWSFAVLFRHSGASGSSESPSCRRIFPPRVRVVAELLPRPRAGVIVGASGRGLFEGGPGPFAPPQRRDDGEGEHPRNLRALRRLRVPPSDAVPVAHSSRRGATLICGGPGIVRG